MPQYKLEAQAEAEQFDAQAELFVGQVRRDIQRSSNYVLCVVLFASSLFFAGMSVKLRSPKLRLALLTLGCAVFLLTAIWIASSPVSVAV
jgi:hypothetical protein